MSSKFDETNVGERLSFPMGITKDGWYFYSNHLTESKYTDPVKLVMQSVKNIPVIFVPGIMGSNLKVKDDEETAWRLDAIAGIPVVLAASMMGLNPGERQKLLDPTKVEVDYRGNVPEQLVGTVYHQDIYRERGWGSVGESSYMSFLLDLEIALNPENFRATYKTFLNEFKTTTPADERADLLSRYGLYKAFKPITDDQIKRFTKARYPVHAFGYNWLDDNAKAAAKLKDYIAHTIQSYNNDLSRCEQVIIITHSMGGLVARYCSEVLGAKEQILGMIHGVMPANGAAVAYRRCKVGMRDEDYLAGLAIGNNGPEVTAVFAQSPGALQLLPNANYGHSWLRFKPDDKHTIPSRPLAPGQDGIGDPYQEIYLERNRWWGLIHEQWLAPKDGNKLDWEMYADNIGFAKEFHEKLGKHYHAQTYSFHGCDVPSFDSLTWEMRQGTQLGKNYGTPPASTEVMEMSSATIGFKGNNPELVRANVKPDAPDARVYWQLIATQQNGWGAGIMPIKPGAPAALVYWQLIATKQNDWGDGTVPVQSAAAPRFYAQQTFAFREMSHEPAYQHYYAKKAVNYAVVQLANIAKITA